MEYICRENLSEKAKEFLNVIRQNTYRQQRLVNNILDVTKMNAGYIKMENRNIDIVYLTRVIVESVHLYAGQKSIDIGFHTAVESLVTGIDEEKYERILLNLLSNAIKFTPEHGSINVSIYMDNDSICVSVTDTGIGIPQDKLELIFEKFGQVDSSLSRQAEGTGIGLSLVKMFVEAMKGCILVNSNMGKGTSFTVKLPVITSENNQDRTRQDLNDNRLVQAALIEFSDIYL
jgi:two-component system sensor histidine kinase/response regulator